MDSFDIIQQKEWSVLTEAEKENVFSIAENEKEYNLIKIMLLTTAAEKSQIPALPPSIYENLQRALPVKKSYTKTLKWLSAACLATLLLFSVYILNKNKEVIKYVEHKSGNTGQKSTALTKKEIAPPKNDSLPKKNLMSVAETYNPTEATKIASHNKKPKTSDKSAEIKKAYSISSHPELLSLITEVY